MTPIKYILKFVVSILAVLLVIMILPALLISDDISIFKTILHYLFNESL